MWIICICLPFLYASFFFSFYLTYFLPSRIIGPMCFQARCHRKWLNLIFRSSPERWPNKPGKNVRPYIHMSTMKHNAATNQIMIFVKVDETFTMIWLSRSSEVRVKVMWDLKFQKWRFSNSVSSTIFQPVKKFQQFLILDQNISGRIFEFSPSYQVTWLQILPKNTQKFFPSNETWYDVRGRWDIHDDMTFKVIRGQGQGQEMTSVPLGTIFSLLCLFCVMVFFMFVLHHWLCYYRFIYYVRLVLDFVSPDFLLFFSLLAKRLAGKSIGSPKWPV